MDPDRAEIREGAVRTQRALLISHTELETRLLRALRFVHAGDRAGAREVWNDFEQALEAHLRWEEEHVLPGFDAEMAHQASVLRADHAGFRGRLAELGAHIAVGNLPEDEVRAFLAAQREHAEREEATMYRYAEKVIERAQHEGLFARIEHALEGKIL